jgi:hypothetical protein
MNMAKLHGRGLVDRNAAPATVLEMDFGEHPDRTVLRFQLEIAQMLSMAENGSDGKEPPVGFIELREGGSVASSDDVTLATFANYRESGAGIIRATFGT